jgi:hypothetical protein
MRNAHGVGTWVGDGRPTERDSISCGHCNKIVFVKPGTGATTYLIFHSTDPTVPPTEEPGAFCRVCMSPVCLPCHDVGTCRPIEKWLEQEEARDRLYRRVVSG